MKNSDIKNQCRTAAEELVKAAGLQAGDTVIIGCSTSEVSGSKIGTGSNTDTAAEIFDGLYEVFRNYGIYLAVQCCEHLNRAVVAEKSARPHAERVNAVPQPKAGGALAAEAYRRFECPILLEDIKADAGLDIGGTLIGMHLKKVAVPVRLSVEKIGEANLVCARVRPKFVGGSRAVYDEALL